ncbi:GNAT family N-acetyltransferase [Pseudalkalibacillus hwajinpoensis]|uniref:GNAT family N-acetyltransferase n=1 Tax=Guptibacillus hwajinpoensis TaxID=208199 RepID=A0A4U1MLG2_9BACL|nr:GNAT family N-acetyltransferase [Pseudalkalibacillus hwajinpoensis]TKD71475.1 GNAT family N-acetyltransferase [Pseudalkalibacillus hwajinpoensis]
MHRVNYSVITHLDDLSQIDAEVIGNERRKKEIEKAIQEQRCLTCDLDGTTVGFLIFHTSFFDHAFISLLMVSPSARRKGVARSLINRFEVVSPTNKIFSSTNNSNKVMHQLFHSLGYVISGSIDHLDEDDPEIIYYKSLDEKRSVQ